MRLSLPRHTGESRYPFLGWFPAFAGTTEVGTRAHCLAVSLFWLKVDLDDAVDEDAGGDDALRIEFA